MDSYFFLGAQLPHLNYEQGMPMSSADFIALVQNKMSSKDSSIFKYCTLNPCSVPDSDSGKTAKKIKSDFIKRWNEWEESLRLNLASGRAKKLKRQDAAALPSGTNEDAAVVAKHALSLESPLEAEMFLDKARWNAIDNLKGMSIFSESAMYAYFLKLLLMERRACFNTEEGFAEYKRLYAAILADAGTGEAK